MDYSDGSTNTGRGRPSKVVRVLEKYELEDLGEQLEQLWTAENNRYSLRKLADHFNNKLLQHQIQEHNVGLLDVEGENIYRLLTDVGVSRAENTRLRRRLEREGIDVDVLEVDFVSYQAIRIYLKNHRDVDYKTEETDPIKRETKSLQKLRGRTTAVTESKLEQLRDNANLELGGFQVLLNVQVVCD